MKVVTYSTKPFEKEFLVKANQKKHDITFISNPLNIDTASFAEGKDAVIVFVGDDVTAAVVERLAALGVKFIATRSVGTDHIDKNAATLHGIKLANVPIYSPAAIAEHTVALALALSRRLVTAAKNGRHFDFRLDELLGFNFHNKTVGLIGLGHIGQATASIFNGFGCRLIGYDVKMPAHLNYVEPVALDDIFRQSDIISLHLPLTTDNRYLINASTIAKMKTGVMVLNTSRGALLNTLDVLDALHSGKIGYLGLDAYEYERGLFFEDHEFDLEKDPLLQQLLNHPNVLVTPHQAYLTKEALQELAVQTIKNLDLWQQEKCVGNACVCLKKCRVAQPEQIIKEQQLPLP